MTSLEKEAAYGIGWIAYDLRQGIPDTTYSMFQRKLKVIHGPVADVERFMEEHYFENGTDPRRWALWYALKVSKKGIGIYGNYSVPLCVTPRDEKRQLLTKSFQLAIMMEDERFDCLKNYKKGYLMKVPEERKAILESEFDTLDREGIEVTKKLDGMGVGFSEQLAYYEEYRGRN
jgi:hypothetical protein